MFPGSISEPPTRNSMRIVFVLELLIAVSLFTSYSAIIVVLLQAPAPPITSLSDLMRSPLQLCMQDLVSNTRYVNVGFSYIQQSPYLLEFQL